MDTIIVHNDTQHSHYSAPTGLQIERVFRELVPNWHDDCAPHCVVCYFALSIWRRVVIYNRAELVAAWLKRCPVSKRPRGLLFCPRAT